MVQGDRFVLRALHDRAIEGEDKRLRTTVAKAPVLGRLAVEVAQRGGARDLLDAPCDRVLTTLQWKMLWVSTEKRKPIPTVVPTRHWACHAIGRLGGWLPRKGTRPGWQALWEGWARLEQRIEGGASWRKR